MTKTAFLAAYRAELLAIYSWTIDADKLARFCESGVVATLNTGVKTWDHTGAAALAAWRTIGGKGKPTLKALRALPA